MSLQSENTLRLIMYRQNELQSRNRKWDENKQGVFIAAYHLALIDFLKVISFSSMAQII